MKFVSLHLLTSFSLLLLPIVFPKLLVPIARAETQVTVTQTDAALL
jgi:hypothetical protein